MHFLNLEMVLIDSYFVNFNYFIWTWVKSEDNSTFLELNILMTGRTFLKIVLITAKNLLYRITLPEDFQAEWWSAALQKPSALLHLCQLVWTEQRT